MAYETQIPDARREMRLCERAEARQAKREAIQEERRRTEQLTKALRLAVKTLIVIGSVLVGIFMFAVALAGATPSRRRR